MKRRHPRIPRRPNFQRLDARFVMDAAGMPSPIDQPTEEVAAEVAAEVATEDKIDETQGTVEEVVEFVADENADGIVTTPELVDGEEVVEFVRGGAIEDRIRTVLGSSDEPSSDGEVTDEMFQTTGLPDDVVEFIDGEITDEMFQTTSLPDEGVEFVDGEFTDEMFQTTGLPDDAVEFVVGEFTDEMFQTTGLPDDAVEFVVGEVNDEMMQTTGLPDGEVESAGDGEVESDGNGEVKSDGELVPEVLQTTGVPTSAASELVAYDVNNDGGITALDALSVINFVRRQTGRASESRESLSGSTVASPYDVNGDSQVTPLDALVILNKLRRASQSRVAVVPETDGQLNIPVLPGDEVQSGSQTLTLADIGPYGVLTVEIAEGGNIVVTGNSEVVASTVGEDGRIFAGDLELPVLLVTGVDDKKELVQVFGGFAPDVLVGSKSLTLADIGPYGVLTIEIAEDGSVVATGNSEVVTVTVGENGQITVGDTPLHVFLIVGADGTNELIENFGAVEEPIGITSVTFENIGPYAYFDVMINEDGSLSAVGHKVETNSDDTGAVEHWTKEAVTVSVGEDGRIFFGEIALPVVLVTSENGASELIPEFGKGDDSPINSEMAGAKLVTVVAADGQPIIVQVTEENGISVLVGAEEKQATLDEDSHVVVDGTRLPVVVIRSEDGVYLYPSSEVGGDFVVAWPVLVDEVFADGDLIA